MEVLVGTLQNGNCFAHELPPGRSTIGRRLENSIHLPEPTVSGRHAELIEIGGGKYLLRDLASTNGTWVDGMAITELEISVPCQLTFGTLPCQLRPSDGAGAAAAAALAEKDRTIAALTAERDRLAEAGKSSVAALEKMKAECDALARKLAEAEQATAAALEKTSRNEARPDCID